MELSEMNYKATKINTILESRFGFSIDFNTLSVKKAKLLCEVISRNLTAIRHSDGFHKVERNARYMELITVREGLIRWVNEQRRLVNEGEVGSAEVLLAAKDMVDSIQDMIEKSGKMQNEQLPQLLDSIREEVGAEQAEAFKNSVSTALTALMDQLQVTRDGVDSGVRVLSGEQVDQPMDLGGAPDEVQGMDAGDEFNASDAAAGGTEPLGRALR